MARSGKPKPPAPVYAEVPLLLPRGGSCLILGSGPSLTQADVTWALDRVDTCIAVNDAYKYAPGATCLYAADAHWWQWHKGAAAHAVGRVQYPAFTGPLKYTLGTNPTFPGVQLLHKGQETGLAAQRHTVALGRNSCYQAVNVAVHFGATHILLLGVDMQGQPGAHFFGRHPNNSGPPYNICLQRFATLVAPLAALGVRVSNCTRKTALTCFPCVPLEQALALPGLERVS